MGHLSDLQNKLKNLGGENQSLADQVREGQEKLRLSANQVNTLIREIEEFKRKVSTYEELERKFRSSENDINALSREIERLNMILETRTKENMALSRKAQEADVLNKTIQAYEDRLSKAGI